jgi:hypothetical protein
MALTSALNNLKFEEDSTRKKQRKLLKLKEIKRRKFMKKFNQVKITLFDSTIASFKLSVEANFTRARQDGSLANLAYISDKGTAVLNPSIYLVFSFKGDTYETSKNLYTSFPQLFSIRKTLSQVKDLLVDNKGFMDIEGVLSVRPEYQQPIVIADIGKQSKSISFTLVAIDSGEEGMPAKVPGVSILLSDSEYVSVLTAEELLTIHSIVNDLDLTSYLIQLSHMFLEGDEVPGYAQPVAYQQPVYQQPYQQPAYQPQPTQQGGYQPRQQQAPRYGQAPMQRTQPAAARQPQSAPQVQQQAPAQQSGTAGLPPRKQEKQIVNMKSVEETPVSSVSFNDEDAINSIFDDNN